MSDMPQQQAAENPQLNRNPYTLWFVILSFAAPVLAAYYMFFFGEIRSFTNNGEFLKPYVQMDELAFTRHDAAFDSDSLDRKWHLFMITGSSCDEACQAMMINMRQINRAVKRPPKARHMIVMTAEPDTAFGRFIEQEMPQAIVVNSDAGQLGEKLDLVRPQGALSDIYITDPNGYVVMRFPLELDPKLVIKDLNRLF